ncbi:hypothetical protein GOP47_0006385 [Adiantum capillus-veneris]|uniref:Uncharacterized protein n=1 Tax=Adiantum capillus-veneris TaxID=13818 RepID=A0A9D4ZKC5_ADICA|nr:hypothetical protein GOP47_0006385 [Adiantum capillus-veneris]
MDLHPAGLPHLVGPEGFQFPQADYSHSFRYLPNNVLPQVRVGPLHFTHYASAWILPDLEPFGSNCPRHPHAIYLPPVLLLCRDCGRPSRHWFLSIKGIIALEIVQGTSWTSNAEQPIQAC